MFYHKAWLPLLRKCMRNGRDQKKFSIFYAYAPVTHAYTQQNTYVARGLNAENCVLRSDQTYLRCRGTYGMSVGPLKGPIDKTVTFNIICKTLQY